MKILHVGTDPRPQPEKPWWIGMRIDCDRCGSQFLVDKSDDVWTTPDENTGHIAQVQFRCMVCQKFSYIPRPIAATSLAKLAEERQPV